MMNCKECIHFEVCAYVSHYLQACDSYEEPTKHGKWIKHGDDSWECSECHSENCYAYDNNLKRFTDLYCPNCGAKIDGKVGEQE